MVRSNTGLDADGMRELCTALRENPSITDLNLSRNRFGEEGATLLEETLDSAPALRSLDVRRQEGVFVLHIYIYMCSCFSSSSVFDSCFYTWEGFCVFFRSLRVCSVGFVCTINTTVWYVCLLYVWYVFLFRFFLFFWGSLGVEVCWVWVFRGLCVVACCKSIMVCVCALFFCVCGVLGAFGCFPRDC